MVSGDAVLVVCDAVHFLSGLCWAHAAESTFHRAEKFALVDWLDQERERACSHNGGFSSNVFMAGDENYLGPRRARAEVGQQFHPAHPFHPDVQDGDRYKMGRNVVEKSFWLAKGVRFETN